MAGFFGLFDYSKPGKGIRKDEPKRSHFTQFFVLVQRKFWKLIQLNMLFVLCCVPAAVVAFILTGTVDTAQLSLLTVLLLLLLCGFIALIGPAIAGMTQVLRNFANEKPVFLLSDFWDTFKSNFRQSIIYHTLVTVMAVLLWISWQFYFNNAAQNMWMYVPASITVLITLTLFFANFYIYIMIVTLELPLKSIIKNGMILAVLCIKSNLITLFFIAITMFAMWYIYILGYILYIIIGLAFISFIAVYNSYRGVQKYAIDPFLAGQNKDIGENESVFEDEHPKKDDVES